MTLWRERIVAQKKRTLWAILVAIVVGLCVLAVFVVLTRVSSAAVADKLAKIKEAGAPTNLAEVIQELAAAEHQGDAEESRRLFQAALADAKEICKPLQDSYAPPVLTDGRYNEQGLKRARHAFAAHPDLVATVEKWTASPPAGELPPATATPEQFMQQAVAATQMQSKIARALHFRALLVIEDKDWAELQHIIQVMLQFARRCEPKSGAIALQTEMFTERQTLELVPVLLREAGLAEARPILDALAKASPLRDRMMEMVRRERACGLTLTERYPDKEKYWKQYAYNRFRLNYLKYFERLESGLQSGTYGDVASVRIDEYVSPREDAAKMTAPSLHSALAEAYRVEALRRLILVAGRLMEQLSATGTFPTSLREVDMPADWRRDPFDGQELRLVRQQEGWKVYSVGANLHNDGGESQGISDDIAVGPFPVSIQPAAAATGSTPEKK